MYSSFYIVACKGDLSLLLVTLSRLIFEFSYQMFLPNSHPQFDITFDKTLFFIGFSHDLKSKFIQAELFTL